MNNAFTGNVISKEITDIFADPTKVTTLTITVSDPTYYYFRAEKRAAAGQNPMDSEAYSGTMPFEAGGFYKVEVTGAEPPEFVAEINFMKGLGMVVERGSTFYIYDLAEVFYGSAGYFKFPGVGAAQAVLKVLYNFVLPGRFWSTFYARAGLADGIQLSGALEAHMREVYDMVWLLVKF
jgi:hypothetical protein